MEIRITIWIFRLKQIQCVFIELSHNSIAVKAAFVPKAALRFLDLIFTVWLSIVLALPVSKGGVGWFGLA